MKISTMLVGVNFRPKATKVTVEYLRSGDILRLEREPDNPYDINAIHVMKDGAEVAEFLGFVARADAANIAPIMDGGAEVHCVVLHQNGIKEVHLEIEYPDDAVAQPATELPSYSSMEAPSNQTPNLDIDDEVPF